MAKRIVVYDGRTYKVKSDSIEIPDLDAGDRMAALIWLNRNTYRRGHSTKAPNPLAGLGGAIRMDVR